MSSVSTNLVSEEVDEDCAHVVAARQVLHVLCHQLVEQLVQRRLPVAVLLPQLPHQRHHLLAVGDVALPDSVAAQQDELVLRTALHLDHLGQRCHCLLFVGPLREVLVLEVAEGPGKTQRTVHSALLHVSACLLDPLPFLGQIRLVVGRQRHGLPCPAQHGPGVADIGHEVSAFGYQDEDCCCASPVCDLLSAGGLASEALANDVEVFFSALAEQQVVHAVEEADERPRVVLQLEVGLVQDFLGQHLGDVVRDLGPAVAVEHREEMHSFCDLLADDRVLHRLAPAQMVEALPCISQEVKASPFRHLHSIFFARMGFFRYSEELMLLLCNELCEVIVILSVRAAQTTEVMQRPYL